MLTGLDIRHNDEMINERGELGVVDNDLPVHAELFSIDQLEAHARAIAATHTISRDSHRAKPLLPRLERSSQRLHEAYRILIEAERAERQAIASEEWIRDNFHVVRDQIREIRQDLPRQYYLELPKLAEGRFEGYPRVYVAARELVIHTAGRFDAETVTRFIVSYQQVVTLSIGEVWAIPIMLRLALVEDLHRLADQVQLARTEREEARKSAARLASIETQPAEVIRALERRAGRGRPLSAPFVAELLHWLRDQPPSAGPVWHWLQERLDAQHASPDEILRSEHQREASDQISIGNVISSMRLLSSLDWPVFFERVSHVELALRDDPAGAYALMDFPTRDRYRHSIEELAKRSGLEELAVARRALELAAEAKAHDPEADRRHHVGYYLISRGRFQLERDIGAPPTVRERLARFTFSHPAIGYLGLMAAAVTLVVASLLAHAARFGATRLQLVAVALLVLIPASELAIGLLSLVITVLVRPRSLPKLALRDGITAANRTLVVVPTIISSESQVRELFEALEVRFLANRDPHLHFALLTDFPDAGAESLPEDNGLLAVATGLTEDLNTRYGTNRFFFLHRARRWNPVEGKWMGWERKRGKLAELNRLLRGAVDTSYVVQLGDLSILPSVRFVITLDTDTQLPMEAGRQLVGALAHPLNRPRFDRQRQRITEGYGILQPRVQVSIVSATRSLFAQIFSGFVGIDPYTTAVSDVYQDLFHEGSYVGKGIYDVDAFETALHDRVPPNRLLSHDLFEGLYARVGLCTDIHLVDDFPASYLAYVAREHRWVRGDWQIARWLWRTVPTASGRTVRNTLPAIARWKIADNLRRSLLWPSMVLLLAAGWLGLPGSSAVWTLIVLVVLTFPPFTAAVRSLVERARGVPLVEHFRAQRTSVTVNAQQAFLSLAFLAHRAFVMIHAIGLALTRLMITRRYLLEWETAADVAGRIRTGRRAAWRAMWIAPASATVLFAAVLVVSPGSAPVALPILALWAASPILAHVTGLPLARPTTSLTDRERLTIRRIARRTWGFFEDLVGPADHWLVPDNYQESRRHPVAHRTSPTNVGLQILSTLSAHDFGYLSPAAVIERLEPTIATLLRAERYRGHLFNWYDTTTLQPLAPAYVSTVDSGNLCGCLLTLKEGLRELVDTTPIIGEPFLAGLNDTLTVVEQDQRRLGRGHPPATAGRALPHEIRSLRDMLRVAPGQLSGWVHLLGQVSGVLSTIGLLLQEIEEEHDVVAGDVASERPDPSGWLRGAADAVATRRAELAMLAPWISLPSSATIPSLEPDTVPSMTGLVAWCNAALQALPADRREAREAIRNGRAAAESFIQRADRLGMLADDLVEETDWSLLFDPQRQLFSIGFAVSLGRRDASYYDSLASEARLASFVAIAMGSIGQEHWFKLDRRLTPAGKGRALLSWNASMFEYLMPALIMRTYPATLLTETYETIIDEQIAYGSRRNVPWGISESAYNAQDRELNYQYRGFGVPGLGLKRGLADDLVIAPYATMLATPFRPRESLRNLEELAQEGLAGKYGFYEAIDYTPERLPEGHRGGMVLRTYMAHHQGMGLVAIGNYLHENPMPRRFHAERRVQAADLLLQERVPRLVPILSQPTEQVEHLPSARQLPVVVRRYTTAQTSSPRGVLLSNGSYTVMVTNAGSGYSVRGGLAMTRWRRDVTQDCWGSFCYIRDLGSGDVWSVTHAPTGQQADLYDVTFGIDRAVFRRRDGDIEIHTEIAVSTEDDVEMRRIALTNHGRVPRVLELTSYAEVVLAPPAADAAHPAFSNLFVETVAVPERDAIICTRRPRAGEPRLYLVHVLAGLGRVAGPTEFETDRARFTGRGGSLQMPLAMDTDQLSNTTGAVLDPVVSLRQRVRLPPGVTARISFTTGFADSEDAARALVEKYHDRRSVARALALATAQSQVELRHLNLTVEDAHRFQRLAIRLLYGDPRLRDAPAIEANRLAQPELWKHGISGELPIVLVRIGDLSELPLVRELLKAHEYLRFHGFQFDLVVMNEYGPSYLQLLQDELQRLVEAGPASAWLDRPGGVFLRRGDLISDADRMLLRAVARAVLVAARGGLADQLKLPLRAGDDAPPFRVGPRSAGISAPLALPEGLLFFNGLGGFTPDGREYVIRVDPTAARSAGWPPAPWSNVVSNEHFGFCATDGSPGYTWSENSHDNRLTPWRNDPVTDLPGEAVYLRDEDTGAFWSATPLPASDDSPYLIRHGQGYTAYEHAADGLVSRLELFVPSHDPVKLFRLRLRNEGTTARRCAATLYVEWILGDLSDRTTGHVVTFVDVPTGALMARNAFRSDFGGRVAYIAADRQTGSVTGDRTGFIGRNGTLAAPAALGRHALSGRAGAALDPCGAVQTTIELQPGQEVEVVFQLGEADDEQLARALISKYRGKDEVQRAFAAVAELWDRRLAAIQVDTPDAAVNLLLNRWVLYQTLACRIQGRSAFYQSSGAFGFRDQLQDVLALLFSEPAYAREHILRCASRQFVEGDVQHWWHPPGGQGVRTRCSDDRLWLIFATLEYGEATGDWSILDEEAPFLEARPLNADEDEVYERPRVSSSRASLYEHCVRALGRSLEVGDHGLPLIGTGDWNDGMNMVGRAGRGESVWLAWFLVAMLPRFAAIAESRQDSRFARTCRSAHARLVQAVEQAWDGRWYRRAYFDDGMPLGSAKNEECQIDSIAQSWAVIAGAGDPARARLAMEAVDARLVSREPRLIRLLTPPFDKTTPTPGYIQGYVPGIRENGGQYTHAALWVVMAWARLGNGDRAMELYSMANPATRAATAEEVARYRVEPYAVAADVYAVSPHAGRGGWTWYTGSAGWTYRVGVEAILGIVMDHGALRIDPCLPRTWKGYTAIVRRNGAEYRISVENPEGICRGVAGIEVDGRPHALEPISLKADGRRHEVRVVLGRRGDEAQAEPAAAKQELA